MAGVQVGLKDLHYALLTKDDSTGVTYGAPTKIAGAITAKISPKSNTETLYADDGPSETATALGEIEVEIEVKDLPLAVQAALFGHTLENGILTKNAGDTAPYVAIGFRSKKSNGKYRFVWLYKGKFELPEQEYKTAEDKPSFQTPKAKGTFIKREFDDNYQVIGDEDETGFTAGADWFKKVYEKPAA
ncbi:phage tail protein [Aneurinibacillus sp. BA2021]|nr:phage tail protein [Aneurinibacillus sp. BA2021]